jgi:hypothetical protein
MWALTAWAGMVYAEEGVKYLEISGNKVTFYGFLRLDTIYSDSRLNHNQYSMWARREDISLGDKVDDEFIDFYPRLTRFGLKVERDSIPLWSETKLSGNLEIDFQNRATSETEGLESESREVPRLRHAYLKVTNDDFSILGGQTWDVIAPLWPSVNADAMMWNSGNMGDRRPQLRFSYEPTVIDEVKLQFQMALARTGAVDRKDLDGNSVRDGDDSGKPMVQFRTGAASLFNKKLDIGIWGHRGWEETGTAVAGEDDFSTYSLGSDVRLNPIDRLIISAEWFTGKNLSDLRGGIGQGVNKTTGDEISAKGGWIDVAYKFTDWYTLSTGFGLDKPDEEDLNSGDREKNTAFWIGNKFNLGGGFSLGAEYIHWNTDYKDQEEGDDNRFDLYAMYSF